MDLRSNERKTITYPNREDFRTLLNSNSVGSSEISAETVRMINSEIASQVSGRINEMRVNLNSHITGAIEQAISEQVLPTIRETLSELGNSARNNLDPASGKRHRSPERTHPKRAWENIPKLSELSVIRIITIKKIPLSHKLVMKSMTEPLGFFNIHVVAKHQKIERQSLVNFSGKKVSQSLKNLKGDVLVFFNIYAVAKHQKIRRRPFGKKKFLRKKSRNAKKTKRRTL